MAALLVDVQHALQAHNGVKPRLHLPNSLTLPLPLQVCGNRRKENRFLHRKKGNFKCVFMLCSSMLATWYQDIPISPVRL